MFKRKWLLALGLVLAWSVSLSANAGVLNLDSFVDLTTPTINLPATKLLMATVNTSAAQGGNDATDTTVTIAGTVVAADVAEVCVDYAAVEIACQLNPASLTNILIALAGNQKGGSPFDYRVTLNPSAAGKTILVTVVNLTIATDNIPLPQSTATSNIAGAAATAPTVTTDVASGVTPNQATLGGTIGSDGGDIVIDVGVYWHTAPGAEAGTKVPMTIPSPITNPFTGNIAGLSPATTYYFKAYATNSIGETIAANELQFTTLSAATAPTVTTDVASGVTPNQATLGGTIGSDGGDTVIDVGVYWHTAPGAEAGTKVPMTIPSPITNPFTGNIAGLSPATTYYFKAYATNSIGETIAANELQFTTLSAATAPTVTTPTFTAVTGTTATLGGNVTADGGAAVTARGVVWDTTSPPETGGTVVPIGSGLGTFSQLVGSLPTDTLVYFRAYATNSAGTAYSSIASFTPSHVQASNITFPNATGKSMRISWTRGNGDGSIVVLRLSAVGLVDPADGTDYTANPDFTLAEEIPTGNFVIYKGSSNNVWVTGLTLSTSYSVAIYEYTGTGASSTYLLNPAVATKTTTAVPVHNEDNRVNCTDCHNHNQFFAHDEELKVVCETCHNPTGPAAAKLEFNNHLIPSKNPAVASVDCGACHELHNPGGANTTESFNNVTGVTQVNKSFLRANVDKYITTAVAPAYLHTDSPGNNPDRAVEGGTDAVGPSNDTQARGYCQVCHSLTANHTNNPSTSGSLQTHDGAANDSGLGTEVNCGLCHQHSGNFAGGSCPVCHSQEQGSLPRPIITTQFDRLSSHITGGSAVVTQDDCLVCHDQTGHPGDQIVGLKDVDDGVTIYEQATAGAATISEGEVYAPVCLSCHADGNAASLAGVDQTPTSPFTGSIAPPIIDPVDWSNASHNRPVATSGASPVTCIGDGSNGCHGSGHGSEQLTLLAPAAGAIISPTDFCLTCHDANGPSSINILAQFTPASPQEYTGGSNYATVNKKHDVLPADQAFSGATVSCKNCHNPHTANNAMPAKNPDTGAALGTYSPSNAYTGDSPSFTYDSGSGTDLDPTNPIGPGTTPVAEIDYIEFCLTCHDGTAPPGVTLPGSMLNIAVAFATTDQHGNLVGNGSASRGFLKTPWATQAQYDAGGQPAPYAAMNCTMCHGPHGSDNIYNLRSSITVAGVQMQVGGVNSWEGESGTTYTLPLNGSTQEQFGWGAWCTFCHEPSHDTKTGLGCQSGHTHGGGNF